MSHSIHHPVPVDDCFGCKVRSIGFDGKTLTNTTRDELGNDTTEHRSGRVDIRIHAKPVVLKAAFSQN